MKEQAPPLDTLVDLENRHEDLLKQLDDLDKRVSRVLKDCLPSAHTSGTSDDPMPSE